MYEKNINANINPNSKGFCLTFIIKKSKNQLRTNCLEQFFPNYITMCSMQKTDIQCSTLSFIWVGPQKDDIEPFRGFRLYFWNSEEDDEPTAANSNICSFIIFKNFLENLILKLCLILL